MTATLVRTGRLTARAAQTDALAGQGTHLHFTGQTALGNPSDKYWKIARLANTTITHNGKRGTAGMVTVNRFATDSQAAAYMADKISEKDREGYFTVKGLTTFAALTADVASAGGSRRADNGSLAVSLRVLGLLRNA